MSYTIRSTKKLVAYGLLTVALMPLILPMFIVKLAWLLADSLIELLVEAW